MRRATPFGVALLSLAVGGCTSSLGMRTAEILDTPFPATLTHLRAPQIRRCDADGCWVLFDVRVTNPTSRSADVAQCSVTVQVPSSPPRSVSWVVPGPPGGRMLRAGSTLHVASVRSPLVSSYSELAQLPTVIEGSCDGWDWHGNAPI